MTKESGDAKQCPWCQRWCLKDAACDYIFACGLETKGTFVKGAGCMVMTDLIVSKLGSRYLTRRGTGA